MSMFTYIAFPRDPDLSMFKGRTEPSELNSEDSNETGKSEQQQNKILIFPRRFEDDKQNLQDFCNFAFQGISVYDQGNVRFNHVFNNQYVYSFSGRLEDCRTEEEVQSECPDVDIEFFAALNKILKNDIILCKKQLVDLAAANLHTGESIEIYSEYVRGLLSELGPLDEVIYIDSDQILTTDSFNRKNQHKVKFIITQK